MSRVLINHFSAALEAAYRTDPFRAFRKNLDSATPEEWDVRPSDWSRDEFGDNPELTICDLAFHVGGGLVMYANRAFGDATMGWGDIATAQSREKAMVLAWLDEVQAAFAAGLAALEDDAKLRELRPAPWGTPLARTQLIGLMPNHLVYHSGEVNRQRALIRGSSGWDR